MGRKLNLFAGVGSGRGSKELLLERVRGSEVAVSHWKCVKVLIVDQISMVDAFLFTKLNYIAKCVRNDTRPFGGIQLIVSGDFLEATSLINDEAVFCFESGAWKEIIQVNFELRNIHLNIEDDYLEILKQIRVGTIAEELKQNDQIDDPTLDYLVHLLSRRINEKKYNEKILGEMNSNGSLFHASDDWENDYYKTALKYIPAPKELKLKVGAQVVLMKNIDKRLGLINGTIGKILEFDTSNKGYPIVKFQTGSKVLIRPFKWDIVLAGKLRASRTQIPLRLAWGISIEKSKGMVLQNVKIDSSQFVEFGEFYTALTKVGSIRNIVLKFMANSVCTHPRSIYYYDSTFTGKNQMVIPIPCTKNPICEHCRILQIFINNEEDDIDYQISREDRVHLHTVISYFNIHQGSKFSIQLTHDSHGKEPDRILQISKSETSTLEIEQSLTIRNPKKRKCGDCTENKFLKKRKIENSKSLKKIAQYEESCEISDQYVNTENDYSQSVSQMTISQEVDDDLDFFSIYDTELQAKDVGYYDPFEIDQHDLKFFN